MSVNLKTLDECYKSIGHFPFTIVGNDQLAVGYKGQTFLITGKNDKGKYKYECLTNTKIKYQMGLGPNGRDWILIDKDYKVIKCSCAFHTIVLRGKCECDAKLIKEDKLNF